MARKNKHTQAGESERVTLYLPPDLVKTLKLNAINQDKTYSDLAAEIFAAHFKQNPSR